MLLRKISCRIETKDTFYRSLEGGLRIGLAEKGVITALAQSTTLCRPGNENLSTAEKARKIAEAVATVKSVYNELPCFDQIIPALLEYDVSDVRQHCYLRPGMYLIATRAFYHIKMPTSHAISLGIPLKPMLAFPTKQIKEILDRFEGQEFISEYKYDGERAQASQASLFNG